MNGATALPLGEHLVLASSAQRPLIILAPVDAAIWSDLSAGFDSTAVADRLTDRFGFSGPQAGERVSGSIAAWGEAGLLAPQPPPPPARSGPEILRRLADGTAALGPARRRTYALCGRPIEVRFSPPDLDTIVHARLAHSEVPGASPEASLAVDRRGARYLLREAGRPTIVETTELAIAGNLVRRIVELSHPHRGWSAVLHAAAVGTADGRAVVLSGSNGRGKSILTAALLAAGYSYLSDDCAPVDTAGRVAPVPFGLCVKQSGWPIAARFIPEVLAAPTYTTIDGTACRFVAPRACESEPLPPAGFVFPRYRPGTAVVTRQLKPVETLWLLARNRAWITANPEHLAGLLGMLEHLPAIEIDYDDVRDAIAAIGDLAEAQHSRPRSQ